MLSLADLTFVQTRTTSRENVSDVRELKEFYEKKKEETTLGIPYDNMQPEGHQGLNEIGSVRHGNVSSLCLCQWWMWWVSVS